MTRALNRRGMKPAESNQSPEIVIAIDYSISPPQPAEKLYWTPIMKRVYPSAPKIQANGANVQLGAHNADTQLMKPPDVETVGYVTRACRCSCTTSGSCSSRGPPRVPPSAKPARSFG